MLFIEHDAMLVIVSVGGILKLPALTVDGDGNRSEILSCRVGCMSCKACIFGAKLTLGVATCLLRFCRGNVARILFGLRSVDGYIQRAVFRVMSPFEVLRYSACTNVVRLLAIAIVPIGRFLGGAFVSS